MSGYENLRIGIALSGGGARGIAHIGVIKALLEEGIVPTIVSGTSSGAIIACLYAFGASVDELVKFAHVGSGIQILRLGNPLRGLIKLSLLREKLEAVLPVDDFSCLKYKLAVTAADLQRGKLKVFREGQLIAPVQASCAIPVLFHPVEIDGTQYIDGGLYMNLPSQPIRQECDVLIGSNVMPLVNAEVGQLSSVIAIASRVFDLSVHNTNDASRQICDFLIEPAEVSGFGVYNFTRTDALIEVGYKSTKALIPQLKDLLERRAAGIPAGTLMN